MCNTQAFCVHFCATAKDGKSRLIGERWWQCGVYKVFALSSCSSSSSWDALARSNPGRPGSGHLPASVAASHISAPAWQGLKQLLPAAPVSLPHLPPHCSRHFPRFSRSISGHTSPDRRLAAGQRSGCGSLPPSSCSRWRVSGRGTNCKPELQRGEEAAAGCRRPAAGRRHRRPLLPTPAPPQPCLSVSRRAAGALRRCWERSV